jgi:MFS superfamily sulfate permease-like transporter
MVMLSKSIWLYELTMILRSHKLPWILRIWTGVVLLALFLVSCVTTEPTNMPQATATPSATSTFVSEIETETPEPAAAEGAAARRGYEVNSNQELVGIGSANLLAGIFNSFPVSTSGSRTAVAEQSGAKTQLTEPVTAGLTLAMLLFFPGLGKYMP